MKRNARAIAFLPWVLLGLTVIFSILAAALGFPADLLWLYLGFVMYSPVGTVIALRRPENSIGWLYSVIGLSTGIGAFIALMVAGLGAESTDVLLLGGLSAGTLLVGTVVWVGMFVSLMLFPTGRFLSRRWAVVGITLIGAFACGALVTIISSPQLPGLTITNPFRLEWLAGPASIASGFLGAVGFGALSLGLISVVLRFVRSRGDERLQFKWFTFSVSLLIIVAPVFFFRKEILGEGDSLPLFVLTAVEYLLIAAVPVSVALAILKYRLYDIDVIIRRTLVYGVLSATLALVYWGGVVLLQSLLRPLTGDGNDLAVVATTLAVVVLFLPLRRVVQAAIDRRFYRRKYDAAKTLSAFGQVARDEVELEALKSRLVAVVEETMQPEHVSLWLAAPKGRQIL